MVARETSLRHLTEQGHAVQLATREAKTDLVSAAIFSRNMATANQPHHQGLLIPVGDLPFYEYYYCEPWVKPSVTHIPPHCGRNLPLIWASAGCTKRRQDVICTYDCRSFQTACFTSYVSCFCSRRMLSEQLLLCNRPSNKRRMHILVRR